MKFKTYLVQSRYLCKDLQILFAKSNSKIIRMKLALKDHLCEKAKLILKKDKSEDVRFWLAQTKCKKQFYRF